eukprot:3517872-Prymnesium_polylepis.1
MSLNLSGLLPAAHSGSVTTVALGSPKVLLERPPPAPWRSRIVLVVNNHDPVPRLLGSPSPVLQAVLPTLRTLLGADGSPMPDVDLLRHCERFEHPDGVEVIYLRGGGEARRLAPETRSRAAQDALLHIGDLLSPSATTDHLTYVGELALARARAA